MFYDAELCFMRSILQKCHIQTHIVKAENPPFDKIDLGFRSAFGISDNFQRAFDSIEEKTIYVYTDAFGFKYNFMLLPEAEDENLLVIGPFFTKQITYRDVLEQVEKLGENSLFAKKLELFYSTVPYLPDENHLAVVLGTFGETVFGTKEILISERNSENIEQASFAPTIKKNAMDSDNGAMDLSVIEERYKWENEMLEAVSRGQYQKACVLLSNFSPISMEKRVADPLRNLKNYLIVMNTLLRKAAENGGVHPFYLDKLSSEYAIRIEQLASVQSCYDLMPEIFKNYCRLVRKHTMKQYSPPVQRAIMTIDSDLTANLTLNYLATAQNLSPSYLSALFSKETGMTLTEYVNMKRVSLAMRLLATTKLQIQTIAQHCGILDVHYFSKVFKKAVGLTPKQYRENHQ